MKNNKKKNMSIIHLGSIYGLVGQDQNLYKNSNISENLTYSIIKGGIIIQNRWLHIMEKQNIRVNTIAPGGMKEKYQEKN